MTEYEKGYEAGLKETIPPYLLYVREISVEYRLGYFAAKEGENIKSTSKMTKKK